MKYAELTQEEKCKVFWQIEPYLYDKNDGADIDQLIEEIMDEKIPALRWTGNINYDLKSLKCGTTSNKTNKF